MADTERVLTEAQAYEAAFRFVARYRERERKHGPESLDLMLVAMEPGGRRRTYQRSRRLVRLAAMR